jgi:hypothetical protein
MPQSIPEPQLPWWARSKTLNKYADFEDLIGGAGSLENAGQQIDDVRTNGPSSGYLPGLAPENRAQFDRYVHGATLDEQNPGLRGLLVKGAAIPAAGAYELAKNYPPLLNAVAKIPGFETLAVDDTTSPPSYENYLAFTAGAARGMGRTLGGSLDKLRGMASRRLASVGIGTDD